VRSGGINPVASDETAIFNIVTLGEFPIGCTQFENGEVLFRQSSGQWERCWVGGQFGNEAGITLLTLRSPPIGLNNVVYL